MFFCLWFVWFVFALDIPKTVQDNCIIQDEKYIDTCPSHWEKLKWINEQYLSMFDAEEKKAKTSKDLLLYVNKFLVKLHTMKKDLYTTRQLDKEKMFTMDYMIYIIDLYREIIQSKIDYHWAIQDLFEKTYYNQQQVGLVLQSVSLFEVLQLPQVYDSEVTVKFNIRNFEQDSISKVEDIYCFTTLWEEDFIFPLEWEWMMFPGNNISNIVGTLKIGDNTLTTIPWEKQLYCMMVYFDNNKEITTPFVSFNFTVE